MRICGNRYFRGDLHIHSPASEDYGCPLEPTCTTDSDPLEEPKTFLLEIKKAGLDFAAITDHNQITHLTPYIEAAREIDDFILFPGVELHIQGGRAGIHYLAIFPENLEYEELVRLSDRLGLANREGDMDYAIQKTSQEIGKIVSEFGGILIAAHTDSSKGLTEDVRGAQRTPMVNDPNLIAMEITRLDTARYFDGSDPHYKKKLVIQNSDAHCLCKLGETAAYYKMEEVSFKYLQQALMDYEMRVKLQLEYPPESKLCINHVRIDSGFLEGFEIDLNPGLNCIIGARGAGKSVLIETIRFVLSEYLEIREEKLRDMMNAVLGDGRAEVCFQVRENNYVAGRDLTTGTSLRDWDTRNVVLSNELAFSPRIFSQKELNEVAGSPSDLRNLLDKSIPNIDTIKESIALKKSELADNREKIVQLTEGLPDKEDLQNRLEELNTKLEKYTQEDFERFVRQKDLREKESNLVQGLIHAIQHEIDQEEILEFFFSDEKVSQLMSQEFIEEHSDSPNLELFRSIINRLSNFKSNETNWLITKRRELYEELFNSVNESNEELEGRHTEQEEEWQKFKNELSGGAEEELRSYEDYVNQIKQIKQEIGDIENIEQEINSLKQEREDFVRDLAAIVNTKSEVREQKVQDLKSILPENLSLEIIPKADKTKYIEFLVEELKPERIYKPQVEIIANYMSPTQLANVSDDEIKRIFQEKLTDATRKKLVAKLESEFKMKLKEIALNDLVELKMQMRDGSWKPAASLSIGQRSTALLPLVMEESEFPLIIDQPEDDMDNAYIYKTLIEIIRKIKEKRQLIFATHNPNIPVSGDADLVIHLVSDDVRGQVKTIGSIDNSEIKDVIQDIMEGGTEAFEFRAKKYGYDILHRDN